MAYTVRRTTFDEWPAFKALRLKALLDSPTNFGETYENALAMPDEIWQKRATVNATSTEQAFYVAVDDATGELVGMWGTMPHWHIPRAAVIVGVFVVPEARGTDVAKRLNDACIEFAKTTSAKELILDVRDDNDRGRRFYEREGWTLTGNAHPHDMDPAHDLLEMRYESFR